MKKKIALIMIVTMFLLSSLHIGVLADSNLRKSSLSYVATEKQFSKYFGETSRLIESFYSISSYREKEDDCLSVTFSIIIDVGNESYCLSGNGIINEVIEKEGKLLWSGPVDSQLTIENKAYHVIVGVSFYEGEDKAQFDVTIQPFDSSDNPACFTIGDPILENNGLLEKSAHTTTQQTKGNAGVLTEDTFTHLGYKYGTYTSNPGISGNAHKHNAYFSNLTNRFAISIKTYCSNVNTYFSNQNTPNLSYTHIYSCMYDLTRNSCSVEAMSYIAGFENFDFPLNQMGKSNKWLWALFEDALALIGVPTSTITTLYNTISDDFYGKITQTYNNSNHYRFDILFGVYSEIDFDVNSSFKGYPIVFQLAMSSPANYQGNSSYKVTTDVRYVTKQITNIGTVTSYYYTDSNNAEKNYTVTLQ